ncbi:MAG: hypothetical protein N2690_07775 [Rhodocyclaceae bacterium]|nr:hypothetical protein [Rhodocyclaceae bacterium]
MGVSIREFADRAGVSHTAVRKAIERGDVVQEADGSIDPQRNAAWRPRAQARRSSETAATAPDTAGGIPDYAKSRAIREAYAARLAKLEYDEKSGRLVSADEVRIEQFRLARALRDRLMQLPAKLAPEIVALVAADPDATAVETMLETELRELLDEFVRQA